MSALEVPGADFLSLFAERFEKLDRALDEALTGVEYMPARRRRKDVRPRSPDSDEQIKLDAGLILSVLRSALLEAPDDLGALDYYQLKAACRLNDDRFGLALNELIPSQLKVRSLNDDRRLYFLRRELRLSILTKAGILKRVA